MFTTVGISNWKKALHCFEQHSQSSSHKEAVPKMEVLKQPDVASQLSSQHKKDQAIKRNMFMITFSSLKFLLRQGLAIGGHEEIEGNLMQLLLLQAQQCSDLKQYINNKQYLSNEIVDKLISLVSNMVLRQILLEV